MQKSFLLIVCLPLFFSCERPSDSNESTTGNILENLTYTVDTVVVDANGEIINLQYGMQFFDLSDDKTSLLLFDRQQTIFQEINLDQMALKTIYPFEKEGPNGLGRSSYFQILPDRKLMIPTFSKSGIYNLQGDLLSKINLSPYDIEKSETVDPFSLLYEIVIDPKSGILYSLPGVYIKGVRDLAIIDSKTSKGKIMKLPKMEKAGNFRVFWNSEQGKAIETESYYLTLVDDILLITCTVGSGIYRYDPRIDSLEYFDFNHQIIPNEKIGKVINEMSTEKEFLAEYRKVASQISFRDLMWDNQTSRFYRLATKTLLGETTEDSTSYEVYLLAYDKELNLIGETFLKDYNQLPQSYFFKDGKLYSYVNVEDELGFAVFTFNF